MKKVLKKKTKKSAEKMTHDKIVEQLTGLTSAEICLEVIDPIIDLYTERRTNKSGEDRVMYTLLLNQLNMTKELLLRVWI